MLFAEFEALGDDAHGVFLLRMNPMRRAQRRAEKAHEHGFLLLRPFRAHVEDGLGEIRRVFRGGAEIGEARLVGDESIGRAKMPAATLPVCMASQRSGVPPM